ncbi:MAG: hypothetical protein J5933_07210 [Clostridia bacterium]|nr:hypothetical protein [Clostridia bacterium]
MKKTIVLILALSMLILSLVSCENGPHQMDEDKGPVISAYLTDEMYNFDPALAYTDDSASKIISLLYEGLMRVNSSGRVEKALAKEIVYNKETNIMKISLNQTKWSDGRDVSADDVVYAWKRILEPDFDSEACALLFDIKNARDVKRGDKTIDDLGLAAVETYVVEIEFEREINQDEFLENLASPALVPLREDVVGRNPDWAKRSTDIRTNGQFILRKMVYGDYLVIERSSYYYRDMEKDEVLNKYVKPYRFYIQFNKSRDENMTAYENEEIYFMGEIPLAKRAEYKDKATVRNLLSTHTYYFNTDNKLFSDSRVRKALSLALDRQAIADLVVFATPATGIVPNGVYENTYHKDFRKNGGDLISSSADVSAAKSLLSEAKVNGGSFSITVRESDETAMAIAKYCQGVWKDLGFNVSINALGKTERKSEEENVSSCYDDDLYAAYVARDFDVIAIDAQALSTTAFGILAPFAKDFSGMGIDLENQNYDAVPHKTGFDSSEYNAYMEEIFQETDLNKRAEMLHEAEKMLLDEMPVIPIVFNQNAYLSSGLLSGIDFSWYGTAIFKNLNMRDYNNYLPDTTAETISSDIFKGLK